MLRKGSGTTAVQVGAVVFDFYQTLVGDDQKVPDMWQTLSGMGFPCKPRVERLFNSAGHDGLRTPSGSSYPWQLISNGP